MLKTEAPCGEPAPPSDTIPELFLVNECVTGDTLKGLVRGPDAIIEQSTRPEAKAMVIESVARGTLPDVPLVAASGLAGYDSTRCDNHRATRGQALVVGDHDERHAHGALSFGGPRVSAQQRQPRRTAVVRVLLGLSRPLSGLWTPYAHSGRNPQHGTPAHSPSPVVVGRARGRAAGLRLPAQSSCRRRWSRPARWAASKLAVTQAGTPPAKYRLFTPNGRRRRGRWPVPRRWVSGMLPGLLWFEYQA